jgi:hypothetical protein
MPITIMVDAYLITLRVSTFRVVERSVQVGRSVQRRRERVEEIREVPPGQTAAGVGQAIATANQIWAPASIVFRLSATQSQALQIPGSTDTINDEGFLFLIRRYPARNGVTTFFVNRFQDIQEGGNAVEEHSAGIVASLPHPQIGKTLAHELGHLLSLGHVPNDSFNLMFPGLSHAQRLTAGQIAQATGSRLARSVQQRT